MHISQLWNQWGLRYKLWDLENWTLIRSNDVDFDEDSILSERNQQKIVGKKVSFEVNKDVVEGSSQSVELEILETVKLEQDENIPSRTTPNRQQVQ